MCVGEVMKALFTIEKKNLGLFGALDHLILVIHCIKFENVKYFQ